MSRRIALIAISTLILVAVFFALPADSSKKLRKKRGNESWATIGINGYYLRTRAFFAAVMPGESVKIHIIPHVNVREVKWRSMRGSLGKKGTYTKTFKAPKKPGLYPVKIYAKPGSKRKKTLRLTVNVFVMYPASKVKNGYLNGYRIGEYPDPKTNKKAYLRPKGYIEVKRSDAGTAVSENYKISDFLCHEPRTWPRYLVLDQSILYKLELINSLLKDSGIVTGASNLKILSAYRTPAYNVRPGQSRTSRHLYGSAIDIFVDNNNDDKPDDLNKDGKRDVDDAFLMYRLIHRMDDVAAYKRLSGGVGLYANRSKHSPFVHVDIRPVSTRWAHIMGSKIPNIYSWIKMKEKMLIDSGVIPKEEGFSHMDKHDLKKALGK